MGLERASQAIAELVHPFKVEHEPVVDVSHIPRTDSKKLSRCRRRHASIIQVQQIQVKQRAFFRFVSHPSPREIPATVGTVELVRIRHDGLSLECIDIEFFTSPIHTHTVEGAPHINRESRSAVATPRATLADRPAHTSAHRTECQSSLRRTH